MTSVATTKGRGSLQSHWDEVYSAKRATEVSWYQDEPRLSLALIREVAPAPSARIVDVGGGASVLVDRLLDEGYASVAVLDISERALEQAKMRLGPRGDRVQWLVGDLTTLDRLPEFDVWHDRAVFHFLTTEEARRRYVALAERTLPAGGHLVIATFALDGPDHCSGLPVCRYDAASLAAALGPSFRLARSVDEIHHTPWGAPQHFIYALFQRR